MIVQIIFIVTGLILFYFSRKNSDLLLRGLSVTILFLGLFLILAKLFGWISSDKGFLVETTYPIKRNIIQTVSATGKIQPEIEVRISPDVSGEIVQLYIIEGEKVNKGDLLLKINPDTYKSVLERSNAALNTAKSSLAKAKAQFIESESNYKRNKILFNNGTISQSDFEKIEASYKVSNLNVEDAKYSVISAEATLNEAQENLNRTNIYAPISGTVSRLNVELGERVVGTAQMAGTEILRLANLEIMEVLVEVNENDINSVSLGDTAIVEVDAFIGLNFNGIVSEIANSANINEVSADQVTNFEVKVRILDSVNFRPGMTATVDIQSKYAKDALALPIQAVTTRKDTGNKYNKIECVFEYKEGIARMIIVESGIQDDEYIQIISGLNDAVEIINGPYNIVSRLIEEGSFVYKNNDFEIK